SEPGLDGDVRESHSIAWNIGAEGSPAKFTSDAKGNTNAPEQADPNSGTTKQASSAGSGTSESSSASEALTAGESSALTTRPGGSGNNGSAEAGSEGQVAENSSTSSTSA